MCHQASNVPDVVWLTGLFSIHRLVGVTSDLTNRILVEDETSRTNTFHCRLKAYCIDFLGRKNQSFRNKSGETQPIRTKFGIYVDMSSGDNSQGILGAIGPFWPKWGLGRIPRSASFLFGNKPRDFSATSQRPILATKRISVSRL